MLGTHTFETEVGQLGVVVDQGAVVVAAGFCPVEDLVARIGQRPTDLAPLTAAELGETHVAIRAYLRGEIKALDAIAVRQPGTAMQQAVWEELRAIPAGHTRTYTQLAAAVDRPLAARAAGTACGRNLIAPIVPCHRALRADGTLGGYYYGLDVKRWLLAHEAADS